MTKFSSNQTNTEHTFAARVNFLGPVSFGSSSGEDGGSSGAASIINNTTVNNVTLVNPTEKVYEYGNTGASANLELENGSYVLATLDQSTQFSFTLPENITGAYSFILQLKNSAGSLSITWPNNIYWPDTSGGSSIPPRTDTNGKTDIWAFVTYNTGSTWLGHLPIRDYNI